MTLLNYPSTTNYPSDHWTPDLPTYPGFLYDEINTIGVSSAVTPSFAWTPSAVHGTPLTFTATTVISNQGIDIGGSLSIIEYRWDFGDGTIGFGSPIRHTYAFANASTIAKLRVTDSLGRQWRTQASMNLS